MNAGRLLGTRYYRNRPRARRALYRRAFGRVASFRKAWRRARRNWSGVFAAFFAAFVAARNAHRYQPVRIRDTDPRPERAARRRPMRGRWLWQLRRYDAKRALERYGLDVLGPDGRPDPENRRLLRNARKRERQQAR